MTQHDKDRNQVETALKVACFALTIFMNKIWKYHDEQS